MNLFKGENMVCCVKKVLYFNSCYIGLISFFILLNFIPAKATNQLFLDNDFTQKHILSNRDILIFKDTIGLDIQTMVLQDQLFSKSESKYVSNNQGESDYWVKFVVKTSEDCAGYILDAHSPNAKKITLYQLDINGEIRKCGSTGVSLSVNNRPFWYKNLIIDMYLAPLSTYTYYVHVERGGHCGFDFFLTPYHYFLFFASTEHALLGMFYGLLLIMIVYQLIMYFSLKDKIFLAYTLLIISASLKTLSEDRLGATYLWQSHPEWSYYIGVYIAPWLITFTFIYFSFTFLRIDLFKGRVSKYVLGSLLISLIWYLILLPTNYSLYSNTFVFLPYAVIAGISIRQYFLKKKLSIYFVLGTLLFLVIIMIDILRHQRVLFGGSLIIFSFYIFMVIQSLVLALSIIDRLKMLAQEKAYLLKTQYEQEKLHYSVFIKERQYTSFAHELKTFISLISAPLFNIQKQNKCSHSEDMDAMLNLTKKMELYADQILKLKSDDSLISESIKIEGDIVFFVKNLVRSFNVMADKKFQQLIFDTNYMHYLCSFDASKLEKIIFTLLSNAIKHNDEGENVHVSVFINKSDKVFVLNVKDNGKGISEEYYSTILKNKASHSEGVPYGLRFIKSLIEALEGTLDIISELNKGTSVTVALPLIQVDDRFVDSSEEKTVFVSTKGKGIVFMMDSNSIFASYLASELSIDYEVTVFKSTNALFDELNEQTPDMIIYDDYIQNIDVFDYLYQIKTLSASSKVMLMSNHNNYEYRSKLMRSNFDGVIFKPFKIDDLRFYIPTVLSTKLSDAPSLLDAKHEKEIIQSDFEQEVRQIISNNIDNTDLNVEFLVKTLGISRAQLYRKFAEEFGLSVKDYITRIRITEAAAMLIEGEASIKEVMYRVGFTNRNYFIKCFKESYSVLPSEFKKVENKD